MKMDYRRSGVDIDKANAFVDSVKHMIGARRPSEVMEGLGGFGAFYDLSRARFKKPVIVSSCDGVGTKLKIALAAGIHHTVGIDLVAMSVNDVLCSGARPLFFLDYVATGKIDPLVLKEVMKGIVEGCRQAECALVGGETAEMPGMYKTGEYDLAGFCVGMVDKDKILGAARVKIGDAIVGFESSGLHSNGFSLVRKVFEPQELKGRAQEFLIPTKIYTKMVMGLLGKFNTGSCVMKALAHITGGAFFEKAARVVPSDTMAIIYRNAWSRPSIFDEIQERGAIADREMFRTFNMGLGMIAVVDNKIKMDVVRAAARLGVKAHIVGEIVRGNGTVSIV